MSQSEITTVTEFYEMARSHWSGHFVYRGENSPSYSLLPKFGRAVVKRGFAQPGHEQPLLRTFEREAITHLAARPVDDWEWLAIAQHHGLATRLLDWTTNPLVGAFFACADADGDAVIYAFDTPDLPTASLDLSPFAVTQDAIFHPRHASNRIAAQAGLFTVHAEPTQPFSPPSLQRHVVKADVIPELFTTLATFDVTRARLFPGLDGLASHTNMLYGTG